MADNVKIEIDLKKKNLKLDAPQEYIEKHLGNILDYMGKKPTVTTSLIYGDNELIKVRKRALAETCVSLAVGIWTIILIGYTASITNTYWAEYYSKFTWINYLLASLGGISLLFSILIFCCDKNAQNIVTYLENTKTTKYIKLILWLIILTVFAIGLLQTGNVVLAVLSITTFIIAFLVLLIGLIIIDKKPKAKKINTRT